MAAETVLNHNIQVMLNTI